MNALEPWPQFHSSTSVDACEQHPSQDANLGYKLPASRTVKINVGSPVVNTLPEAFG
jgi:hypothetical protein